MLKIVVIILLLIVTPVPAWLIVLSISAIVVDFILF